MALKYKLILKANPAKLDDPKKYYASAVNAREVSLRALLTEIAEISTVSPADTQEVIESLLQIIPKHVSDGRIVRLGDFGSFGVRLSSDGSETEEAFNKNLIKNLKLQKFCMSSFMSVYFFVIGDFFYRQSQAGLKLIV